MSDDFPVRLEEFGALPEQLVDLAAEETPRALRYVDLRRAPSDGRPPVVLESHGQPRGYVFDRGASDGDSTVRSWVRRIAFRGDADWVAVLRPGRLDVFHASLDGGEAPREVEGLQRGQLLFPSLVQAPPTGATTGIRNKLLELLHGSIRRAKDQGVAAPDALSLVGRALFWRFLIDRGLLEGLNVDDVCPGADGWPDCLASKSNALRTFRWLDETFNGGLLHFASSRRDIPAEAFSSVVGNISHLATLDGQLSLRLPKDWSEVNFAHVPVGLLSEVYEAYAHAENHAQARAESIFYTPRHIAEFVVEEALQAVEGISAPRVLDPAVGAGVFLVAMFRALVAREWKLSGAKPSRRVVRRILNSQLVGFDINDSALRLAELALYLTAIELDPNERPRPLSLLKFDELRERVLLLRPGGKNEGSLSAVEPPFRSSFDVVIGNPPWTAKAPIAARRSWAAASRAIVAERLGKERAAAFDFPDTNPDLPFIYRAMEWAKPGACIALATHARWMFGQSPSARRARTDLLECLHVTGLLNGAELRDTSVWPNVRHAFCLLFAANELPPPQSAFQFVSPQLDRMPDRDQERLRIDWRDASEIEAREVIERPWTLKARFRGTAFDESVVDDLHKRGIPLSDYLSSLGTKLRNGYQVGGNPDSRVSAVALRGLPDLRGTDLAFLIPTGLLERFARPKLLRPRARDIYRAPLLLVHESMRAAGTAPRAGLSLEDVAFDERFDGASFAGIANGSEIAAYLQLIVQSSVTQHAWLLLDGQFGVEREVVHLETIEALPVVPWHKLSAAQQRQCGALSRRLHTHFTAEVRADIDRFAADVWHLSALQRETIAETLATALPTAESKWNAIRATTSAERQAFASTCQDALADVLHASRHSALVRCRDDIRCAPWHVLQIDRLGLSAPGAQLHPLDPRAFVQQADEASASMVTIRPNATTTFVGILDHFRYWTRTRARLLASLLLSGPAAHG